MQEGIVYDPAVFTQVYSLGAAKRIILTAERERSTDERWRLETPHICDLIDDQMKITVDTVVLDYGCGIGRIAKELIQRHRCRVLGVDIAPNMLGLAESYVNSDRFLACSPSMLEALGLKADVAIAVWVLQHVVHLDLEIQQIRRALPPGGGWLFVVNEGSYRCVPTKTGWVNDGQDVRARLVQEFRLVADGQMDEDVVGEQAKRTFWAVYQ